MEKLTISSRYLERESKNHLRSIYWSYKNGIMKWLVAYCFRNKIVLTNGGDYLGNWIVKYCKTPKMEIAFTQDGLTLYFKSKRQLSYFLSVGNKHFPHFEFI